MDAVFRSALASRLQAFWDMRRLAGQQGLTTLQILRYLDRFLVGKLQPGDTITEEVAQRWFRSMQHLSAGTRLHRITVLRQICLYLRHFDPRTCIVHRSFFPRCNRPTPYIYTRQEVGRMMAAAKRIGPPGSLRPAVAYTVIGLLFSTGLRIGEALKLTIDDIDLERRLLHIRLTKFKKSRYVPLSPSTTRHLAAYLAKRRRAGFPTSPDSPVFVSLRRNRYSHTGFTTVFMAISRKLGIRGPQGQRGARIHDARHSFSVHRLLAWHRSGANLFTKFRPPDIGGGVC